MLRNKIIYKVSAVLLLFFFTVYSVAWSLPNHFTDVPQSFDLQVQSIFNPIIDSYDKVSAGRIDFELRSLISMALRDRNYLEMNAAVDTCYLGAKQGGGFLRLVSKPQSKDGKIFLVVELTKGIDRGKRFVVTLPVDDIGSYLNAPGRIEIEPVAGKQEGLIAKGDMEILIRELRKRILDVHGNIESINILPEKYFDSEEALLEKLSSNPELDSEEAAVVKKAVERFSDSRKIIFDGVILDSIAAAGQVDHWLLGFDSESLSGVARSEPFTATHTLAYAHEALYSLKGDVLLEYLIHEPLCGLVGHLEARKIQEKLFADSCYRKVKGSPGRKKGLLSEKLRLIIDERTATENIVYRGAEVGKNGKRKGGEFIGSAKDKIKLKKLISAYPDVKLLIEKVRLTASGVLSFMGKKYWSARAEYKNAYVTVEWDGREVVSVYDRTGRKIYPYDTNRVYTGGIIKDGKKSGGSFLTSSGDKRALKDAVEKYPDCIVENFMLSDRGALIYDGQRYWNKMKGYENAPVTIVFKEGELAEVYDEAGVKLFPDKTHRVYVGSEIQEGKRKGGLFVGAAPQKHSLNRLLEEHPDCVVEDLVLNGKGGLRFCGEIYWDTFKGYENALVTVVSEGKKVTAVYDSGGKRIYPVGINRVYSGAFIVNGKRRRGAFRGAAPSKQGLNKIIKDLTDYVIEDFQLNGRGGLVLGRREPYWQMMKGYEKALVTVVVRKGTVTEVYDSSGEKIYPHKEHAVYAGARIFDGRRIGGTLAGTAKNKQALNVLLKDNPDCIVENVPLSMKGGLQFGGKIYWRMMTGYESAYVTLKIAKGKEIKVVYDGAGKRIYPFNTNRVYTGGVIKDGKREGGTFLTSTRDKKSLRDIIAECPDCIVENITLTERGGFSIGDKVYWHSLKGYESGSVTVEFRGGGT